MQRLHPTLLLRALLHCRSRHPGGRAAGRAEARAAVASGLSALAWSGLLARALVLASLLAGAPAPGWAAAWEARTAQNLLVRITQDSFRSRDAYLLQRLYPDGTPDANFGNEGSTAFALGPDNEGPAALRLDALGRAWVAGASLGDAGRMQAVVLRFTPDGRPDLSYARAGRSATAPDLLSARALDLLPQPDGSCWVVGLVTDEQGQERTAWWRLLADGSIDPSFAAQGVWRDRGAGSTAVLDWRRADDGSVALLLRREDGGVPQQEAWVLAAGARQPALLARRAAEQPLQLEAAASSPGHWPWVAAAPSVPAQGALAESSAVAASAGAVPAATPGVSADSASAAGERPDWGAGRQLVWALAAAVTVAVVAAAWRWRARRRSQKT